MILAWLTVVAAQDLPTDLAETREEGTAFGALLGHPGGGWFASLEEGSSEVRVLDAETWEVTAVAVCSDHGGGPAGLATYTDHQTGELGLFTGCADGTVERLVFVERLPELDDAGAFEVADQPVLGLAGDDDGLIVAVEPEDGTGVDLHAYDTELLDDGSRATDPTQALATPTRDGFEGIGLTATYVLVAHGGQYVTEVARGSGAAVSLDTVGTSRDWIDVVSDGGSEVYFADTDGVVGQWSSGTNEITTLLGQSQGLDSLSALALQPDGDDAYLAVAESADDEIVLFPFTGATVGVDILGTLAGAEDIFRMAVVDDVLVAATSDGRLLIFTDDPWVTISSATTATLATGDAGEVVFSADSGGDWALRLGSVTGTVLDSGTASAGEDITASFAVDDGFSEGTNRLFAMVDDGHDAVDVTVDDPPGAVDLSGGVSFGDQAITLRFDPLSDGDIASYDVYFTTESFTAGNHATGGPDYTEGSLSSPEAASADDTGQWALTLTPLTNDTTYYVAVRATDTSGQEGPMSTVYSATPEPIAGAAELAGERGGFFACGTAGGGGSGAAWLLAGLLVAGRRRSAGLAGLVVALGASSPAHALPPLLDLGVEEGERKTEAVSLDIGPTWFSDSDINGVYGTEGLKDLTLRRDWQWYRVVGVSASLGLIWDKGDQLGVSTGTASGEIAKLKVVPVRVGGVLRLDLFDGQPVVPMATVGVNYLLWWETTSFSSSDPFASDRIGGGKAAWDWGVGVDLLLDWFDRPRAEGALARWGIYDSYLTVRYDQVRLLPGPAINDQGLDFGHSGLSVGLRLGR